MFTAELKDGACIRRVRDMKEGDVGIVVGVETIYETAFSPGDKVIRGKHVCFNLDTLYNLTSDAMGISVYVLPAGTKIDLVIAERTGS